MVLILLIMLNMLLAIIMDTYTDVKQKVTGSDTLWFQAFDMHRRRQQRIKGLRVSIHHCFKCLIPHIEKDPERIIHPEDFMAMVSDLKHTQAERLMVNAVTAYRQSTEDPLSLAEAMSVIATVHSELELLHEGMAVTKTESANTSPVKAGQAAVLPVLQHRSQQEIQQLQQEEEDNKIAEAYYKEMEKENAARRASMKSNRGDLRVNFDLGESCWNGGGSNGAGSHHNYSNGQGFNNSSQNAVETLGCRGYGSVGSVTILGRAQALREGGVLPQHRQQTFGLAIADPAPSLAEAQQADMLLEAAIKKAQYQWNISPDRCRAFCTTLGLLTKVANDPVFCMQAFARAARKWDTGQNLPVQLEQKLGPASFRLCPCVTEQPPAALPARSTSMNGYR